MNKKIAIPIETKVREYDGKLWLGLNLINRGNQIIIGPTSEIKTTLDNSRPDIYISKDPGDSNGEFFDHLQSSGISVCGLDTEGAVFESMGTYAHNKQNILNHMNAFFMWGEIPANTVRQHYNDNNKTNIYVTGNPRFDLLQPEMRHIYKQRSGPLNNKYENYILINGNFTLSNPYSQRQIKKSEDVYGSIELAKHCYADRIFHSFMEAIYHLQNEFPETHIIIRPHPSERNATYEEAFSGYDRIHVEDSGDARDWIAGAGVTIHHDCTTGIESALMGRPVVSYRPIQKEEYESRLPQFVSREAYTREELTEYVSSYLQNDHQYKMTSKQTNELEQYFHNIDELAAENICDVIKSLEIPEEKNYDSLKPNLSEDIKRRVKSSRWSQQAVTVYHHRYRLAGNESVPKQRKYRKQKFPGLEKNEILESIDQMKGFLDLNSVSVMKVPLTNNTYRIQSGPPDS